MLRLPAIAAPKPRDLTRDKIFFYHPGYPRPTNTLFRLPRVDPSPLQPGQFGVDARTALVACQIVANNAFSTGYLASDATGTCRVEIGPRSVLTHSEYWFFVDGDPEYPIVPSFRDWVFPHGQLPSFWSIPIPESSSSSNRCLITNTSYALTEAHLVPKEEKEWFLLNGMPDYGNGRYNIQDPGNTVDLRSDIHICLDSRVFAFVPKPDEHQVEAFVVHVLDPRHPDFAESYHNRTLQISNLVSREFIFARFAWTVIQHIKPFIVGAVKRRVVRVNRVSTETDGEDGGGGLSEAKMEWLQPERLNALYGGGGSKSASPRKRKAPSPRDNSDFGDDEEQSDKEEANDWYTAHLEMAMERENARGRKRARLSDHSFTTNMSTPPLSYSAASDGSIVGHDSPCHADSPEPEEHSCKPHLAATTSNDTPLIEDRTCIAHTGTGV